MNKKRIATIALITLVVALLIYVLKGKKGGILMNTGEGGGEQTPTTGGETPVPAENGGSGGNQGNTNSSVGCQSSCCGNECDEISENNPAMNYGCCGMAVKNFQNYLNSAVPQNVSPLISEDGAYGAQTQAKHEAYLQMLPTTGQDITAGLYTQGAGSL
jgi:hypothetical protein